MHFGAKFSLVLRCIRSIGGAPAPPLESATAVYIRNAGEIRRQRTWCWPIQRTI